MLIYIAGPYTDNGLGTVGDNIANARKAAIAVWENGHYAICPHLNTGYFQVDCKLPEDKYLDGYIEILSRCDFAIFMPGWQYSKGSNIEKGFCQSRGVPYHLLGSWPKPKEWYDLFQRIST